MRIFGGVLPFIGFRPLPITWDGDIAHNGETFYYTGFCADVFCLVWLGCWLVLYRGKIRIDVGDVSVKY